MTGEAAKQDLAGGKDAPVEVTPYDPAWPARFAAESERLRELLPGLVHIGSTAVPGLAAKPVIDCMALVDDLDAPLPALSAAGYQAPAAFNATLPHRRFLCRPSAAHRTHHLHLVDDPFDLARRVAFRDALRNDDALRDAYAALKQDLAQRFPADRDAYTDGKGTFVAEVLGARGGPDVRIRPATAADWPQIWPFFRATIEARETFVYAPHMTSDAARDMWLGAEHPVVTVDRAGTVLASAITGPNRPGPGAHVATASFMVGAPGRGLGRALGEHVLSWAAEQGYAAMQFNAVVETNARAVHLWRSLGFAVIGTVPGAFRHPAHGDVGLHVMHRRLG